MPRKRDSAPEDVLRRVIGALEESDEIDHPSHHRAIRTLLVEGPLLTTTLLKALEDPEISLVRAELVAFLRQAVRLQGSSDFGYGISLLGGVQFFAKPLQKGVVLDAEGSPRDIAILQLLLLLEAVGFRNVRSCGAPDCPRLFVKTYRREFCSVRCQQRTTKARLRLAAREKAQQEQQARARRRRVSKGRQ